MPARGGRQGRAQRVDVVGQAGAGSAAGFQVSGSHTYATAGIYAIAVNVTDWPKVERLTEDVSEVLVEARLTLIDVVVAASGDSRKTLACPTPSIRRFRDRGPDP